MFASRTSFQVCARLICAALLTFSTAAAAVEADVIYVNGQVETLDAHFRRARALAVKGDRILDLGSSWAMLSRHHGKHTRIVNLRGRALLPGFVDAHTHIFNDAAAVGKTKEEMQDLALRTGITTLGDLFSTEPFVGEMQAFDAAGKLAIRTSLYLVTDTPCGDLLGDWWKKFPADRTPTAMLRIPGVKIFVDGGSCGLAATTFPLHLDDPTAPIFGNLWQDQATVDGIVAEAAGAGYQVAIHAIGDRARDQAISALSHVTSKGQNDLRHRIEHNSMVRPDQLDAYDRLGIIPVVWGYQSTCAELQDRSYFNELPPGDESWWYPWRTMLDRGLPVAWHMDYYKEIPLERVNTFHHLYGLVTRKEIDPAGNVCEPRPYSLAQRVTTAQALRMMTLSSAYALHMDSVVGSLERGKFADLIIVSADPLRVAVDDLRTLSVLSTVVGGKPLTCAAGSGEFCW